MKKQLDPARILNAGGSVFWTAKILSTAVDLGLFAVLAAKPMTGEGLGRNLGLHPRRICDFFDALVALDSSNGKAMVVKRFIAIRKKLLCISTRIAPRTSVVF